MTRPVPFRAASSAQIAQCPRSIGRPLIVAAASLAALAPVALAGDDHGDTCDQATQLTLRAWMTCRGRLDSATDTDVFRVPVLPGHVYSMHDFWLDCTFCPRVRVYTDDCVEPALTFNDGTYSDVYWFIGPTSGAVFVAADGNSPGAFGPYEIDIRRVEGPVTDDHTDAFDAAATIQPNGAWHTGAIDHSLDRDVFRFTGQAGHVYLIDANPEDPNQPPPVSVRVTDRLPGGVLAAVADPLSYTQRPEGAGGTRILVPEGAARELFVIVERSPYSPPGAPSYRLRVVEEGPLPPLSAVSTDCAAPAPMPIAQPITVQLPGRNRVAFWTFDTIAGHVYQIAVERQVGPYDLSLNAAPSCSGNSGISYFGSRGQFRAEATGSHILGMYQSYIYVPYDEEEPKGWATLRVIDLGAVEDESPAGAPPIALAADGVWREFHTDFAEDEDRFAVPATPGVEYVVEIRGPGWIGGLQASIDGYLGLGGGVNVTTDPFQLRMYVPLGTEQAIVVKATGQSAGSYQLRVTAIAVDGLRGQGCAAPIDVLPDGSARRMVFDAGDGEDWVRCPARAGHVYRIRISNTAWYWYEADWATGCTQPLTRVMHDPFVDVLAEADGALLYRPKGTAPADVTITDLGVPDDREPNTPDDPAFPPQRLTPNGAAVLARLDYRSDVDHFRVALRPGRRYSIASSSPTRQQLRATLCDAAGNCPLDNGGLWFGEERLETPPSADPSPVEYTLRIWRGGYEEPGEYSLRVYTTGCRGDWNDDGARNEADLYGFIAAYLAGDAAADYDGSGGLGTQDVLDFVQAWVGGWCW